MAYKSQVTNKYMGSSFAGRVNPGRENELTQLAKSLDQFADAFPRGVSAYKGNKVEEAEERLEYLKATMSPSAPSQSGSVVTPTCVASPP